MSGMKFMICYIIVGNFQGKNFGGIVLVCLGLIFMEMTSPMDSSNYNIIVGNFQGKNFGGIVLACHGFNFRGDDKPHSSNYTNFSKVKISCFHVDLYETAKLF